MQLPHKFDDYFAISYLDKNLPSLIDESDAFSSSLDQKKGLALTKPLYKPHLS